VSVQEKRGTKDAVIYDGGFAEQGEDGRRLQDEIEGICREADIALCGPNCMGVLNPHHLSTTYLQELRKSASACSFWSRSSMSKLFRTHIPTITEM
jgi:acyl-CoA synthetase (NDP forming)